MMYKKYIKRILDFLLSLVAIVIISPLLLVICAIIRIKIGKPVFFKQERSGMNEKPFTMYKFRTMTDEKASDGSYLPDEVRLTHIGKFLRSTSLDELPELFSILKGDMSIIGPRPLPISYSEYYAEDERNRFEVRGGLIPPDSVEASPIITWDKQFQIEKQYAENVSFLGDIKILIATFGILLRRDKLDYGSYVRQSLNDERREQKKEQIVTADAAMNI